MGKKMVLLGIALGAAASYGIDVSAVADNVSAVLEQVITYSADADVYSYS